MTVATVTPAPGSVVTTELWPCRTCGRPLDAPGVCTDCALAPVAVVRFRPCAACGSPTTSHWCSPCCHQADEGPYRPDPAEYMGLEDDR